MAAKDPIFGDTPDDALDNIGLSPDAEAKFLEALRSESPAPAAQALGIDAAKAPDLSSDAIQRVARSRANSYEVQKSDKIYTLDETPKGGVEPAAMTKEYMAAQVGPLDSNPTKLHQQLQEVTGKDTEPEQRQAVLDYSQRLAKAVTDHDLNTVRSLPVEFLKAAKLYDAAYFNTRGAGSIDVGGKQIALPAAANAKPKVGPMESFALKMLFDAKDKILPDYTSLGDKQGLGTAPPTDLGGAAAPGSTPGITRGTDAAGNPSFGNAPALPQAASGTGAMTPSTIPQGGAAPAAPAAMASPSQARMAATGSPQVGGVPGFVASGAQTQDNPQHQLAFAQAYKAKHPAASAAEIRQAYYHQYGFAG